MIEPAIYHETYGTHLGTLFSFVKVGNGSVTLNERRIAFFVILRSWLEDGIIKFADPTSPTDEIWDIPINEILDYLAARWPTHLNDTRGFELDQYFFDMPYLLWVKPDGSVFGS